MSLLILLIIIAAELITPVRAKLHGFCRSKMQKIIADFDNKSVLNSNLKVLTLTILPTAIVGLIFMLISFIHYSAFFIGDVLYLIFALIILLSSLNNGELILNSINIFTNFSKDNFLNRNKFSHNEDQTNDQNIIKNDANNIENVPEQIIKTNFNFFAVIFWYLVFNPAISFFYCLLEIVATNTKDIKTRATANKFLHILNWIPARSLGITLVFMGSFERSFKVFTSYLLDFDTNAYEVIHNIIFKAREFNISQQLINNINQLYARCLILWVCVLAFYLFIS